MSKIFHLKCPNIEGEMRVTKLEKTTGDFVTQNDIILIAENKEFILEVRSEVNGVLSKIHTKPGTIIFTNENIAEINTEDEFIEIPQKKEKISDNYYQDAEIDNFQNTYGMQQSQESSYPALDAAIQKYKNQNQTQSIDIKEHLKEHLEENINSLDNILEEHDHHDKKTIFSKMLSIFHNESSDSLNYLSSVEEVSLKNIARTVENFKESFYHKYQHHPIIEPFLLKSIHASMSETRYLKQDELNFILIEKTGKIFKSHIKEIHGKNFFTLQNEIYSNKGISEQKNILTFISNQQSKISFSHKTNVIILNQMIEKNHSAFLTYNIERNIPQKLIDNFLKYLENPGWIFFLL